MTASLILLGYLVGSIPFAFLLARRVGGIDVRLAGSGNVGAANVFRTAGKTAALTVAALDMAKGSAVVILAQRLGADEVTRTAAGVAAIVGHMYPLWLRFMGGKGVATACGVFAVLAPIATAGAGCAFVAAVWITRYVSVGSMVASAMLPGLAYATAAADTVVLGAALSAILVIFRHRHNIVRLQTGTERRFGERS
jgi:glycerol-3-phosphate acyltransferase PlsY